MSQQINLFDPIFRKKGFSYTSAAAMLYAICAVVALAALAAVYEHNKLREVQAQAHAAERSLKEITAARDALTAEQAARKPDARLEAEIAALDRQLASRQEIIDALNNVGAGATGGFSDYMRAFSRQTVNGLWLTGFDIAAGGNELSISGRALSADLVPAYLTRLNQERPLQGRSFAALQISQPALVREPAKIDKDAKAFKANSAPPRYLEFTLSSTAFGESAAQPVRAAPYSQLAPRQLSSSSTPAPGPALKPLSAAEVLK